MMDENQVKDLLGEKRDYLEEMIDASPSCLKIIDKQGRLLSMNCRGLALIESPDLKSVLGADVYDIVHPDHREEFKAFNEKVCEGLHGSLKFRIIGLEGTERWMETYAAPYKLANGETAHIAITNDVTETTLQEQMLKEQENLIIESAKLAELGKLSGNVAHELNNPLMIITGNARQIVRTLEGKQDVGKQDLINYAKKIQETVERMSRIIKGLKHFSHESTEGEIKSTNLGEVIDQSVSLCEEKFKSLGIDITIERENDLYANACSVQISQVLVNLLNNSFDAIEGRDNPWIKIEAKRMEDIVRIEISDSGPGVPDGIISQIMTPFFTTKGAGKGTGLGLSISLGIVKRHGGKFYYNSKAPFSQFVIELPHASSPLKGLS